MKNRRWDSGRMGQKALAALLTLSLAAGSSPMQVLAAASDAEHQDIPMAEVSVSVNDFASKEQVVVQEPAEIMEATSTDEVPESGTTAEESVVEEPAEEEPISQDVASAQEPEASEEQTDEESAETKQPVMLSDNHVVVVQAKKDKVEKGALDLETVSVGDALWANLLMSDTCRAVTSDEGLTYRWLVSDKPLEDPKEYTEVVAETRDLTVTEELWGRFVIVEVSDGTTKCYGPSVMKHVDKDEWVLEPLAFSVVQVPAADGVQQDVSAVIIPQVDEMQGGTDDASRSKAHAITIAHTPTKSVDDAWGTSGGSLGSGTSAGSVTTQDAMSDPLMLMGAVVVFKGSDALVLSPVTGKVMYQKKDILPSAIGEVCHPILSDGVIYVPLSDGSVAALHGIGVLSLRYLTLFWVSSPLGEAGTVSCNVSVGHRDGRDVVIVSTTQASTDDATSGSCTILNAKNGKIVSSTPETSAGYGQTTTLAVGHVAYAGDDAGVVHVLDLATGYELSRVAVSSAPLCGSVVAYGKDLLVMDRAGVLHRLQVLKDGTLRERSSVVVGTGSMSSPVVSGKVAVCATCGPQGKESSTGSLVVVNLDDMQVTKRVTAADGLPLAQGGITAEPLVSVQGGDLWCYFAVDGVTGTVYRYRVGDAHATKLYVPPVAKADRATHPLVCDAYGSLYYLNASGFVTKLVAAASHPQGGSNEPESGNTKPANEQKDQGGTSSDGSGAAVVKDPAAKGADAIRRLIEQQSTQQDAAAKSTSATQTSGTASSENEGTDEDVVASMSEALAASVEPEELPLVSDSEATPLAGPAGAAGSADGDAPGTPNAEVIEPMTVEEGLPAALKGSHTATDVGLAAGALALVGLFFHLRGRASL